MTMRSAYESPLHPRAPGEARDRLRAASEHAYLFVYPMVKSRPWYPLPRVERQRMMDEHIAIGHRYHEVRINTTHSYGLDDQEFVVAFEADAPGLFLGLVRELRESEASSYTERDTPMLTGRRVELEALPGELGLGGD
jgi:chlorite dismutase